MLIENPGAAERLNHLGVEVPTPGEVTAAQARFTAAGLATRLVEQDLCCHAVQDKVFVPFFTTKPGGSGIGLSLCRQIMNRHGGNITLQSAVGHGSCFILLFP